MNSWNQFLSDGNLLSPAPLTAQRLADGFIAALDGLGLIAASGADAASFLHGQLTNDVEHLGIGEARLAGYCSPKGRLLASFLMWRDADTIFLQLPRAIQAPLQKRLQMFVLRAKAKLADAGADWVMLGLGGARAGALLREAFGALPDAPYRTLATERGTLIRVADAFGAARYQCVLTPERALALWPRWCPALANGGAAGWELAQVHAGVPQIEPSTQDQFVPQMVNYELLGGVNFKKGCYPGQEIVARSQYLGKLKRRSTLVRIPGRAAKAGDELYALSDPGQPCGKIVNAAPNGLGGVDALAEMTLAAIDEAAVRLGAPDGVALQFLDMPYALDRLAL